MRKRVKIKKYHVENTDYGGNKNYEIPTKKRYRDVCEYIYRERGGGDKETMFYGIQLR